MGLEAQRKDEEWHEEGEVTTEPKRFTAQGTARGFSLFGDAQALKGTWRLQQLFGRWSSATVSSMMRKRELLPRHHWIIFFKRVDKIESIKESEPVPLASDVSEISACPPSVGEDPSALLSQAPLPPLGRVTLLVCSLAASLSTPAALPHHCTFQGPAL